MIFGILSDIHSNLTALDAVLDKLRERNVGAYICLGDIVGYGPRPNQCCQRIRDLDATCIIGNHDEAVLKPGTEDWFNAYAAAAVLWTRAVLSEENTEFLRGLPEKQVIGEFTICHGSLEDPWGYITEAYEAASTFELMTTPVCFIGHSHCAEYYELDPDNPRPRRVQVTDAHTLTMAEGMQYIINPGSVGQPRDRNPRASCAAYDTEAGTVEIIRASYDIKLCQEEMLDHGLPPALAYRLMVGV